MRHNTSLSSLPPKACSAPSSHFKCMSHFILFFFSSSSVEGLFLFPDGSNSGLQQPVYEPAWSSWPCFDARQHEPSKHGCRNDAFQHERAAHGHEPAEASWNESLQHPWAEDASASLPRPTPSVFAYTGHKEAVPRRGTKFSNLLYLVLSIVLAESCYVLSNAWCTSLNNSCVSVPNLVGMLLLKYKWQQLLLFSFYSFQVGSSYVSQGDSH